MHKCSVRIVMLISSVRMELVKRKVRDDWLGRQRQEKKNSIATALPHTTHAAMVGGSLADNMRARCALRRLALAAAAARCHCSLLTPLPASAAPFLWCPQSRELLSPEGLRADGRRAHELRRVEVRLGAMAWSGNGGGGGAAAAAVDGAAYYAQGNTKVLAFVVGPREVSRSGQRAQSALTSAAHVSPSRLDRGCPHSLLTSPHRTASALLDSLLPHVR
jgi:hypothetical protein